MTPAEAVAIIKAQKPAQPLTNGREISEEKEMSDKEIGLRLAAMAAAYKAGGK